MVLVGIGNCGDLWEPLCRATGYGKSSCWGWGGSTLGFYVYTLGVGAATVRLTNRDYQAKGPTDPFEGTNTNFHIPRGT